MNTANSRQLSISQYIHQSIQSVKGLSATEGRITQLINWYSKGHQSFLEHLDRPLSSLPENIIFKLLTSNYLKLSGCTYPQYTEDFKIEKELTHRIFGKNCHHYEFLIVHIDFFKNIIVRRKRDGLTFIGNLHWWLQRIIESGTYSPDYRCFLLIRVFKFFVFDDIPYNW